MGHYSHRVWCCPYFRRDEARKIRCEGGVLVFPGRLAIRDYADQHCGSKTGWEDCSVARMLLDDYERGEKNREHRRKKRE